MFTRNTQSDLTWSDYAEYLTWQAKQWEVKQPRVKKQGKKAQRKAKTK